MMIFFTIGVYNSSEAEFFDKLTNNNIDLLCDIRQRRGVRGSKYAFVNSKRLQNKLDDLNIKYIHVSELAPTSDVRNIQKNVDKLESITKKDRTHLSLEFLNKYRTDVLEKFDLKELIAKFEKLKVNRIALFCVEEKHEACHRSIVTEKLSNQGFVTCHL